MRSAPRFVFGLTLSLVVACSSGGGTSTATDPGNAPAPVVLSRTDPEPPGQHCPAGGQAVRSGIDANRDGFLEDGEVSTVDYVCAAPERTLLSRTRDEPPGTNCAAGGSAVLAGVDRDGDGDLSDAEVVQTTYVCAEAQPEVLVTTASVAAGMSGCANGGTRVQAGPDRNRNGALDPQEIEEDRVVCGAGVVVETDRVYSSQTPNCLGGTATRVRSGVDVDGDGSLSDAEVAQTSYICSGLVYAGFTVHDQADVDYLRDEVDIIRGDLLVQSDSLTELYVITPAITGAIRVHDCPALTTLSIIGGMVGSDIEIARTPELTYLGVALDPSLAGIQFMPILGDLTITDAPKVEWIDLSEVPSVQGSLVLRRVGARWIRADHGFLGTTLAWVGGDFQLEDCDQLTDLEASGLTTVGGSFILRSDDAMERWDGGFGRNHLESVGGDVIVEDNPAMTSLPLESLARVDGGFRIQRNPALGSISHDLLAFVGADYLLADNAVLFGNGFLPGDVSFLSIGGEVRVERNASLRGLWGLHPLGRAGGGVVVRDNEKLTDLSMDSLGETPSLTIEGNASLAYVGYSDFDYPDGKSLASLRSCDTMTVRDNPGLTRLQFPSLTRVRQLDVEDNASLPTCQAQALAAQGHATSTIIAGNLDGATCP